MTNESSKSTWKTVTLPASATIQEALHVLNESGLRIVLVVNPKGELIGTISDGDIRRGLMNGSSLSDLIDNVVHREYLGVPPEMSRTQVLDLMLNNGIQQIPIVDKELKLIGLHLWDEIRKPAPLSNKLFILAGGKGTRLAPLTDNCPKPMLQVGGKPILEHIVERARGEGIFNLIFSTNYLGNVIEEYFGDGSNFGVKISYLREQEKLGTAGALSLLPEKPNRPIILMNGDILTTSDFDSFFTYHKLHGAQVTVAAINHKVNIPYGVIKVSGQFISELVEKPSENFLCNAGIYAISPEVLNLIPDSQYLNMTDFVDICLEKKIPVAVFPIHEYWSDIGTIDDLENARDYFKKTEIIK